MIALQGFGGGTFRPYRVKYHPVTEGLPFFDPFRNPGRTESGNDFNLFYPVRNNAPLEFLTGFAFSLHKQDEATDSLNPYGLSLFYRRGSVNHLGLPEFTMNANIS